MEIVVFIIIFLGECMLFYGGDLILELFYMFGYMLDYVVVWIFKFRMCLVVDVVEYLILEVWSLVLEDLCDLCLLFK